MTADGQTFEKQIPVSKVGRYIPVAGIPSGNKRPGNTQNFGNVGNTGVTHKAVCPGA